MIKTLLHGLQSCFFIQTENQVERLDRLPTSTLDDIVLGAGDDEPVGPGIEVPADVDEVRARDVFRIGTDSGSEEAYEGFSGIGFFQCGTDLVECDFRCNASRDAAVDASVHRYEMRDEAEADRFSGGEGEFLFDLGKVAVFRNAVGAQAFIALAEKVGGIGLFTGAADAAQGIGDDAPRSDEFFAQQGNQWQQDAGRVATG